MNSDPFQIDDDQPITFTHGSGDSERELEIVVDIPVMRRLRHYPEKIDIRYMIDKNDPQGGLIGRLLEDPGAIVDIAYEATRHQVEAHETPEQFGRGLSGDKLDELTYKVLLAIIRFTPDPTQRRALKAILSKVKNAGDRVRQEAMEYIESGELDAGIQRAIEAETSQGAKAAMDSAPPPSMNGSTSSRSRAGSTPTASKGGRSPASSESTDTEK